MTRWKKIFERFFRSNIVTPCKHTVYEGKCAEAKNGRETKKDLTFCLRYVSSRVVRWVTLDGDLFLSVL